ncbi:protein kinase [Gemmatimonadota bacterium]
MKDQQVGHYKILEKLGSGGMGEVWLAEDTRLGRKAALKFLPVGIDPSDEEQARFLREAQAASVLDHSNICTIYEAGETEEGTSFIAMAYCEGETLKERISRGPLAIDAVLNIAEQIGEGLARAHREGVIHRDIKPSNILITPEGVVKIVDFGLATISDATKLTQTGTSMGTVAYAAPEQLLGEQVDNRADIWSLGVVLYEMITGRPPFEAEHEQGIVAQILQDEPEPITALRARVSMDLERVQQKLLRKAAGDRYQHIEDLLVDIRELTGLSIADTTRIIVQPRRSSIKILGAVLIGAAVTASILLVSNMLLRGGPSRGVPLIAIMPFENQGAPAKEFLAPGLTTRLINTLYEISGIDPVDEQTVRTYAERAIPDLQIASETHADYLLRGTIQWDRTDNDSTSIYILCSLRRPDGEQLRSIDLEYTLTDNISSLQKQVVEKIITGIDRELTRHDQLVLLRQHEIIPEAEDFMLAGIEYRKGGSTTRTLLPAIENFENAVTCDSSYALAWALLSEAQSAYSWTQSASTARFDRAWFAARMAMMLSPGLPEARLAMGYCYYRANEDWKSALREFKELLKSTPHNPDVWTAIGLTYRRMHKWIKSIAALQQAVELAGRSPRTHINLATAYSYTRQFDAAIEHFHTALLYNPIHQRSINWLTLCHLAQFGDIEKTMLFLGEIRKTPLLGNWGIGAPDYQRTLSRILANEMDGELRAVSDRSTGWYLNMAEIAMGMGEKDLAIAYFDTARIYLERRFLETPVMLLKGDDAFRYGSLGICYAYLGRMEDALHSVEQAVDLVAWPHNMATSALPYQAEILMLAGDLDGSLDTIEKLLSVPSWMSTGLLQLDSRWDPLRDHPRFQRLMRRFTP